jgi:hypothetical protein
VQRVAHCGIRLEYASRVRVLRNKIVSAGTGGLLSFDVKDTSDSEIIDNVITVDPRSPIGLEVIHETGTSSSRNVYRGNTNGRTPITPVLLKRP